MIPRCNQYIAVTLDMSFLYVKYICPHRISGSALYIFFSYIFAFIDFLWQFLLLLMLVLVFNVPAFFFMGVFCVVYFR